ncbi:MAG TPA: metalloregulator ArsR/SmtB family transcription factor [Acidimicrobiales bacterium]|jgi:DNA-binding transcriptional ArsR family regulator|nr:metalloregulator ArsR/SmtB family transcription factor [Acidimicrobiales bacterium]
MSPVAAVEDVLTALADPTRRSLLEQLSIYGTATATTLAEAVPISRQAVVQHLAVLDSVGLVAANRMGRERRFEVRTERLTEAAKWMEGLAARWDQRLATIKRLAEMGETDLS